VLCSSTDVAAVQGRINVPAATTGLSEGICDFVVGVVVAVVVDADIGIVVPLARVKRWNRQNGE
jgi:hypothetical protein